MVRAPTITSFTPSSQIVGLTTVITGTNFAAVTAVRFNGVAATSFTVTSATSITATVPAGATSGSITVTNAAGTATSATGFTPVRYSASRIAAGTSHACALTTASGVLCWGLGSSGQLGNAATASVRTPVPVSGVNTATAIAAGGAFTCAVLNGGVAGTVSCWGLNSSGQLGTATTTGSNVPVGVRAVGGTGTLTGVTQIAAGATHACALLSTGGVVCWGANTSGQLGNATTTGSTSPVAVRAVTGAGTLTGVTAITAGGSQTCALLTTGAALCWGLGTSGQLGNGTTANRSTPTQVTGLTSGVATIAAGGTHACAVLTAGSTRCWGLNSSRQLGDGTTTNRTTPVNVLSAAATTLTGATAISVGSTHTCATVAGGVRTWGANTSGQLGNNSTTSPTYPATVTATTGTGTLTGITSITCGGTTSYALAGTTINAWGNNTNGQLGDNTTTNRTRPTPTLGF